MSDITIDGDVKAQQGIRFNISIEPNVFRKRFSIKYWTKGFTGENMADLPIGIPTYIFRFTWQPKTKK
jgi:hypothetical protein